MDSDSRDPCQLNDISSPSETSVKSESISLHSPPTYPVLDLVAVMNTSSEKLASEMHSIEVDTNNTLESSTEIEGEDSQENSSVCVKSTNKLSFEVNVNAIESVSIEDQADDIKDLGLKVFDQQTLEKGIWEQVEQESQRLQTEEELAILDTTIKKKELLIKKSCTKQAKSKLSQGTSKSEQPEITELSALQAKQSLLRERLTKGIKPKDDEGESERDRKIRLGEMTPFGTIVGPKTSELHSSLNQYLQKQQELQMKMLAKKKVKRKMSTGEDSSSGKEIRHKGESDVCSSPSPDKNQKKKRKKKEVLGSELRIVPGDEYLSPAPSPGELATIDFEESGSEYVPSEGSPDDDGDAEFAPNSEERSREKGAKSKQSQSVNNDKSTKGKKRKSDGGSSRPKRRTLNFSQDPEDWATDDSDWVCTDDELSSGPENSARKMKKIVKKEKDDGNEDDYYRRIKLWEKSSPGIREELEGNCRELDNDFKVPAMIWGKLYKYQQVGVQWFWELHQQGCGGILGDEMGLGKTVQVIAFLASLRLSRIKSRLLGYRGLGPVLIVCPTTVMHQWVREFHTWFPPMMVAVLHESGTFQGKRENLIKNMMKTKGVVITSYTAVVRLKDALLDADWHYIVLDEGHKIRNPDAQVTMVVKQFRTPHRLILSGSPVQNHLRELWSLMDFVFPGKLGTLPVFMAQFGVPIVQGGYANASEVMVATAFKCATVLKDTITPYLLRRMKNDVSNHISLPPKNEQVLFCRLTDAQRELYKGYLDCGQVSRILDGRLQIFVGLINLRKICNHPHLYSGGPKLFAGESEDRIPVEDRFGHWSKAGKMIVMEALLKMWYRQEHRVLIFTQSKQMLGIMESFIIQRGYKYLKLDGGTSISARQPLINKFNQDKSYFVMILTTKVGGLGVNLTGADRVVIYDPDWNPATDTQARERAWRIGQQNCVTVYRLITAGTIEEKMYHRQIFKQFLCNKVLKDPRQRRFFKSNDLLELFTLKEVDTEGSTETSAIFAGTGSQVHVKKKRSTHDKVEVKSPPKRKETKDSPKMKESKPSPNPKESRAKDVISSSPNSTSKPDTIQFSESKLQHMKQLAAMLSKKLAQKAESVSATSADSTLVTEACDISTNKIPSPEKSSAESTEIGSAESTEKSAAESSEKSSAESTEKNAVESSEKNAVASFEKSAAESTEKNAAKSSEKSSTESSDRSVAESELRLSCLVGEPTTSSDSGLFSSDATINGVVEVSVPANRGKENQYESKQRKVPDCPARNAKRLNQDGSDRRSKSSREKHTQESKKHKKHKKHKKERNATFEGERVPHLVRSSSLKSSESVDEVEHNSKQDDYVLRKLFSKTGLQTAMQHDKIMEGGHADYALIEGEAKKVAQEAVRALKESRRHCWSATSGVPTWTGSSGAIRPEAEPSSSRPKFGAKKKFGVKKTSTITSSDAKEDLPGSSGLLAKIRARNMLLNEKDETLPADKNIVSRSNAELLDDIRAFVAFGAQTDGQATTDEIISHFKDRLPSESSALFKQMLNQVCEFHRSSGGTGLWKLLPDFNW